MGGMGDMGDTGDTGDMGDMGGTGDMGGMCDMCGTGDMDGIGDMGDMVYVMGDMGGMGDMGSPSPLTCGCTRFASTCVARGGHGGCERCAGCGALRVGCVTILSRGSRGGGGVGRGGGGGGGTCTSTAALVGEPGNDLSIVFPGGPMGGTCTSTAALTVRSDGSHGYDQYSLFKSDAGPSPTLM